MLSFPSSLNLSWKIGTASFHLDENQHDFTLLDLLNVSSIYPEQKVD